MAITNAQIQALLTSRGKTGTPLTDYLLVDAGTGQGPTIATWNTTALGPLPTPAELAAITPAQITAADTVKAQRDAQFQVDAMSLYDKARDLALIDQLNVIRAALPTPLPAITPAQALAAVRQKAGIL